MSGPKGVTPQMPPSAAAPPTGEELQRVIAGAARLERACSKHEARTGLYVVRVIVSPSGRVESTAPRVASTRVEDPASYSGVARYIDAGADFDNAVTRCYARSFAKLRFKPFGGPSVGFDHPVLVEKLPPSLASSKDRSCAADNECVFHPDPPCSLRCDDCKTRWRRAMNRNTLAKWQKVWASKRWRERHCNKAPPHCGPCTRLRGERALCIDGQCAVR